MKLFEAFSLTLMVNHACNLRCKYCYTGSKFNHAMPGGLGDQAIRRALASTKTGGRLDLGFFGGEPLIEAQRIREWIQYANVLGLKRDVRIVPHLTTNGTILTPEALGLLFDSELELAISCDGPRETHDRHRLFADGRGSSAVVEQTISDLLDHERDFQVIMVVRPDSVAELPGNLEYLNALGVRRFCVSPDLWTTWNPEDADRLEQALEKLGTYWRSGLPELSINLFDVKLAHLAGASVTEPVSICGYGHGEIAVAPSGNLYPCERLIADDAPGNSAKLPGNVHDGEEFLRLEAQAEREAKACTDCAIQTACTTTCRCSNFVRTGDVRRPDGLLCRLDKCAFREAFKVISNPSKPNSNSKDTHERTRRRIETKPVVGTDCH